MNMSIFRKMILFITLFFLSCSPSNTRVCRFAMDNSLQSVESSMMVPYIIGFVKDFLMRYAKENHLAFERFNEDRAYLLKGLENQRYDLVLSELYPLNFYEKAYVFSSLIIPTGPILVVRGNRQESSLQDFKHGIIAVQESDLAQLDLRAYSQVSIKLYSSNLEALNDLMHQKVDGALIRYIPAVEYVEDTFYERLKIAGEPLNEQGLRFVALKDNYRLIRNLDHLFSKMRKQSNLQKLLMKWDLKVPS